MPRRRRSALRTRKLLEDWIEQAIGLLDQLDGDPEAELEEDEWNLVDDIDNKLTTVPTTECSPIRLRPRHRAAA